jgi:uncharacterized protein YwqG
MTPDAGQAFGRLPDRVKRCVRPSLRIRTTPTPIDAVKLGQSRIGGQPDLPPQFQWPRFNGLGQSFIAQLDLAELAAQPSVLPLPKQGYLAFFYDSEQRTWGFDPKDGGSALVAYFPGPASSLVRTELPADVAEAGRIHCCALRYTPDQNLPDAWSAYYEPALSADERTLLFNYHDAVRGESNTPRHRLGGHADCVQNPEMELECQLVTNGLYCGNATGYEDPRKKILAPGALDWRLLLQVDTDDDAGIMWGDCGTIYYWIREADLRARDFDKCWLILQCT